MAFVAAGILLYLFPLCEVTIALQDFLFFFVSTDASIDVFGNINRSKQHLPGHKSQRLRKSKLKIVYVPVEGGAGNAQDAAHLSGRKEVVLISGFQEFCVEGKHSKLVGRTLKVPPKMN